MKKAKKQPSFFEEPELLRENSCSLLLVITILALILILAIMALVYTKISNGDKLFRIPLVGKTTQTTESVNEKITALKPDEKVDIRIDQSNLTSMIQKIPDFPLKKPQAKINPKNIILSGKTSNNLLSLNVQVYLKPVLNYGRLGWEIESIKTGDVIAPKQLSDLISKSLSPEEFLPGGEGVVVERADLFDEYLLIIGVKK